jgi:hydrogenase maturation protease
LRFLQLVQREVGRSHVGTDAGGTFEPVESLRVDDREVRAWQEAVEREVQVTLSIARNEEAQTIRHSFAFDAERCVESVQCADGSRAGFILRTRRRICGELMISWRRLETSLCKLHVSVENHSACTSTERSETLLETLAAAHVLLGVDNGCFISQLEPEPRCAEAALGCVSSGVFPVLIGAKARADRMLISPIILYDYPEVAAQSPGDLFDATEIDEILSLRIATLTDDEKREVRGIDPRVRAMLERTEALGAKDFEQLHGILRTNAAPKVSDAAPGSRIAVGDRVRLWPKRRADIFDIALRGRLATVRSVEQDFEDRIHLSVTIDDDPGQDLGISGQPGHRFFFGPDEVEPLMGVGDQ